MLKKSKAKAREISKKSEDEGGIVYATCPKCKQKSIKQTWKEAIDSILELNGRLPAVCDTCGYEEH